jgi:hypothetical protein
MGIFKLEIPTRMMFSQILEVGSRRLLAWNARSARLSAPNVIRADRRFETRARDSQLVSEFRAKMRLTEDLMGKLDYSLREIFRN